MHEPQEMCVHSLGQEHPLGESMTTYSRILAWKNPMDREAWEAIVHNIAKSQTQLKRLSTHADLVFLCNFFPKENADQEFPSKYTLCSLFINIISLREG